MLRNIEELYNYVIEGKGLMLKKFEETLSQNIGPGFEDVYVTVKSKYVKWDELDSGDLVR